MNKQEFEKIKQLVENKEKYEKLLGELEDTHNLVSVDIYNEVFGRGIPRTSYMLDEKIKNQLIASVKKEIENTNKQLKLLGYDVES